VVLKNKIWRFSRVAVLCIVKAYMGQFYEVATMNRLHEIIGLFCKRALSKRLYSAKETYNLKEPINRSHPMCTAAYTAKLCNKRKHTTTHCNTPACIAAHCKTLFRER